MCANERKRESEHYRTRTQVKKTINITIKKLQLTVVSSKAITIKNIYTYLYLGEVLHFELTESNTYDMDWGRIFQKLCLHATTTTMHGDPVDHQFQGHDKDGQVEDSDVDDAIGIDIHMQSQEKAFEQL